MLVVMSRTGKGVVWTFSGTFSTNRTIQRYWDHSKRGNVAFDVVGFVVECFGGRFSQEVPM